MPALRSFLTAVWQRWWALTSSAAFTILSIYMAWRDKPAAWAVGAGVVLSAAFLMIACFLAFRDEHHRAARISEEFSAHKELGLAPALYLVCQPSGRPTGEYNFYLRNSSKNIALNVYCRPANVRDGYSFCLATPNTVRVDDVGLCGNCIKTRAGLKTEDLVPLLKAFGIVSFDIAIRFSTTTREKWCLVYEVRLNNDGVLEPIHHGVTRFLQ
jgi:hypothetical protein